MQFILHPLIHHPGILLATILFVGTFAGAVASFGGRAQEPVAARTLVVASPVEQLGLRAREPMVIEHPDGTLFVSGYGEPSPTLWKSRDGGATWTLVKVGTKSDGAIGNSDVDLAVSRDGTLYFTTMGYDRKAGKFGEGTHVAIGVSKDAGATWTWTMLSKSRFDDRPWVEVAPDGTAHVIWNDGSGVCYAVSRDGGATWTERPRIHTQGGSSHLAVGPDGRIAVRIVPIAASGNSFAEGVDLVAVSQDGGRTWQKHKAPGQRTWIPLADDKGDFNEKWMSQPRWVEPLAWDSRGALYYLWGEGKALWLARSADRGRTWINWRVVESKDVVYFPYLVARGPGELAATWVSGPVSAFEAHVARISTSDGPAAPHLAEAPPFRPDSWERGEASTSAVRSRDPAGEYMAVTFLKSGRLAVVSPIQDDRAKRFGFSFWRVETR